jgi:YidC/Oxa1 family membrane protein insertase
MEKRLLLAVVLMTATVLLTNILFPPAEPAPQEEIAADTVVPRDSAPRAAAAAPRQPVTPVAAPGAQAGDTVLVTSPLYTYGFSTRGAALVTAELNDYPSYTREGLVQLVPEGASRFLTHQLVIGDDTVDLGILPFQASAGSFAVADTDSAAARPLVFSYSQPDGFSVTIAYEFWPDLYVVGVRGQVTGAPEGATLITHLGPGLSPHEARDHRSERQMEFVMRGADGMDRFRLEKLRGVQVVERPLTWAGVKDKYFLVAVVAGDERPISRAVVTDLPDTVQVYEVDGEAVPLPRAEMVLSTPIGPDGIFAYQTYLGPQEFDQLGAVGHNLENVTQYAYRWLEPVIRPVAAAILWVLKTLHEALGVAYGWVLILFGVLMRVVLWPLNAKAMRAQMKNMAVQPLMQELREKYKNDPQKQQEELMKLMKEHGFNPLAGCFPLLIPFPVLITLFFVFQNTIAFRGAGFLWLPDLSLRDPLYVLPLFLVASMFMLQLISARASGTENNPQMKMMMYFMPLMMGVLFFTLPAGLNLYYATTNVASIPQQVLIARERKRAKEEMDRKNGVIAGKVPAGARASRRKSRDR